MICLQNSKSLIIRVCVIASFSQLSDPVKLYIGGNEKKLPSVVKNCLQLLKLQNKPYTLEKGILTLYPQTFTGTPQCVSTTNIPVPDTGGATSDTDELMPESFVINSSLTLALFILFICAGTGAGFKVPLALPLAMYKKRFALYVRFAKKTYKVHIRTQKGKGALSGYMLITILPCAYAVQPKMIKLGFTSSQPVSAAVLAKALSADANGRVISLNCNELPYTSLTSYTVNRCFASARCSAVLIAAQKKRCAGYALHISAVSAGTHAKALSDTPLLPAHTALFIPDFSSFAFIIAAAALKKLKSFSFFVPKGSFPFSEESYIPDLKSIRLLFNPSFKLTGKIKAADMCEYEEVLCSSIQMQSALIAVNENPDSFLPLAVCAALLLRHNPLLTVSFTGVSVLKTKECDRLKIVLQFVKKLPFVKVKHKRLFDTLTLTAVQTKVKECKQMLIDCRQDHRVYMTFKMLQLSCPEPEKNCMLTNYECNMNESYTELETHIKALP